MPILTSSFLWRKFWRRKSYFIHTYVVYCYVCISVHMLILFCKLLNQNFKKRILHIEIMHSTPLIGRSSSNSMKMCYHYDLCVHKRLFQKEFHDGFNYFGKICWHMVLLHGFIFWGLSQYLLDCFVCGCTINNVLHLAWLLLRNFIILVSWLAQYSRRLITIFKF